MPPEGCSPRSLRYAFPPGQGQWYDPFATPGRQIYWKQMRDQLFAKGVDGWWLDAPEPEIGGMGFRGYNTPVGPGYQVYNAYPLMHSTGIYQGQRATTDKNVSSSSPVRLMPASSATAPSPGRATSRRPGRFFAIKSRRDSISRFPAFRIGIPIQAASSATAAPATEIPPIPSIRSFSLAGSNSAPSAPCSASMDPTA